MRQIRLVALVLVSFFATLVGVFIAPNTFLNRALSVAFCTVFSFNSTLCGTNLVQSSERVVAAKPPTLLVQGNSCGSGTVTQPTMHRGNDGTMYQVYYDFRRGRETVNSAACGCEYWISPNPNHRLYGIRFVYLVNGQRNRVVPTLYFETADGSLRVYDNNVAAARLPNPFSPNLGISNNSNPTRPTRREPESTSATAAQQPSCLLTANGDRAYSFSSSPDKRRLEAQSNLSEKFLVELVSPTLVRTLYIDCEGKKWLLESEVINNSFQALHLFTQQSQPKTDFKAIQQSSWNTSYEEIAELIDPEESLCYICDMVLGTQKAVKAARSLDSALNNALKVPSSITRKAIQMRLRLSPVNGSHSIDDVIRGPADTVSVPLDGAAEKLTRGKLLEEAFKKFFESLAQNLGCSASFFAECVVRRAHSPSPSPQPSQKPINPNPDRDCECYDNPPPYIPITPANRNGGTQYYNHCYFGLLPVPDETEYQGERSLKPNGCNR